MTNSESNTLGNQSQELGGTMPEDLPTPGKSLKELEKGNKFIYYGDIDE